MQVARTFGNRNRTPANRVLAFDGDAPTFVALCDVLAGRAVGLGTELALADRIVRTPYPLDLICGGVFRVLLRGRAVMARHQRLKGVLALARLIYADFAIGAFAATGKSIASLMRKS